MAIFCSRCGSENPDDSKYCYHCGARFLDAVPPEDAGTAEMTPSREYEEKQADSPAETTEKPAVQPREAELPPPPPAPPPRMRFGSPPPKYPPERYDHPPQQGQPYPQASYGAPAQVQDRGFKVASFGARLGAFVIDFIVLSLITQIGIRIADLDSFATGKSPNDISRFWGDYMDFLMTGQASGMMEEYIQNSVLILLLTGGLWLVYYLIFHAIGGQTPGKFALGIRVTMIDGSPIGFWRSLLRYVVYWIGSKIFYLGSFWAAFNRNVATWHDLAAGTRVYRVASLEAMLDEMPADTGDHPPS